MYRALTDVQALPVNLLFREEAYQDLWRRVAVPITLRETMTLARSLPLVWRRSGESYELVALRGLSSDALTVEPGDPRPLLVEAYPFAAAAQEDDVFALMMDQVGSSAGEGLPALMPDGAPSPELQHRLDALQVYLSDVVKTRQTTALLSAHHLLDQWDVDLTIDGRSVRLEGLAIVARDPVDRWSKLNAAGLTTDLDVLSLLAAHDLSLFKMQRLVTAFRSRQRVGNSTMNAPSENAPSEQQDGVIS